VCYSDGTEAIVGIKAELEKTSRRWHNEAEIVVETSTTTSENTNTTGNTASQSSISVILDVPGQRDDDPLPTFLAAMLLESLQSSTALLQTLYINPRWHWHLHVDILLLSPPLSYPLPLLSLTTHLALLDSKLPRQTSEPGDDPLFDDDWDAAVSLYHTTNKSKTSRPPVTLLVLTVGANIIFDPSRDELAVADAVLAVSFAPDDSGRLQLVALRTVDPPSRLTPPGVPDVVNPATAAGAAAAAAGGKEGSGTGPAASQDNLMSSAKGNVWAPPRGGMKRGLVRAIVEAVLQTGGVGEEVLEGLAGVSS